MVNYEIAEDDVYKVIIYRQHLMLKKMEANYP
jgi:hypothetical protein